jgi:1-acyl-sn-glycerol-3-phosphate acyltransferase
MVTLDEMAGVQGWFLHRLGCFPVNQDHPGTASLRLALDLLGRGEQVVVFPEGRIQRHDAPINLQQGLARLAQMARTQGWDVAVVPIGIAYAKPVPRFGGQAVVWVGSALRAEGHGRQGARDFTAALAVAMRSAEQAARQLVGRPMDPP